METLKCKVQDPGFPDTEVTCLKKDDGQTYFFIEDGILKNGNIISTPVLKEGIGHAPYTSLGLITPQGEILIPFENKNIKPLSNDLLLVERNKPVTESVVEALGKQNDPLSASELIETANTIKQQIKSVMGPTGTYVFDNQFSEASLFTTAGVNLANDYFSFIGVNAGAYYMCKNVVGNSIVKYDPYMAQNQEEQTNQPEVQQENAETPIVGTENSQGIDMPQVPTIENSINEEIPPMPNIDIPIVETDANISSKEAELNTSALVPDENKVQVPQTQDSNENINQNDLQIASSINGEENLQDSDDGVENGRPQLNIEDEKEEVEESSIDSSNIDTQEEFSDKELEEKDVGEAESENIFNNDQEDGGQEDTYEVTEGYNNNDSIESEEDYAEEDNQIVESNDSEYSETTDEDDYFDEEIGNPIIANATNTIRKLLEENRNQRQIIDRQESEIETLNSSNEILSEENSSKTKEAISLRNSNAKYRSDNNDLMRENNRLKSMVQRQEDVIERLKTQNSALKEQVAGITALSSVVDEANNLFAPTEEASTNSEYGYLDEDTDSYQYTKKAA